MIGACGNAGNAQTLTPAQLKKLGAQMVLGHYLLHLLFPGGYQAQKLVVVSVYGVERTDF